MLSFILHYDNRFKFQCKITKLFKPQSRSMIVICGDSSIYELVIFSNFVTRQFQVASILNGDLLFNVFTMKKRFVFQRSQLFILTRYIVFMNTVLNVIVWCE